MSTSLFTGEHLRVISLEDGIVEICLDRKHDAVNKVDEQMLAELSQALIQLPSSGLRGILFTSAKEGFLAGADIAVLQKLLYLPHQKIVDFFLSMDKVLVALEDLPVPVVCAVNGYALGGGLEVALSSDYRVITSGGQVGFPEVGFGVLPGASGTVRTPRLTDAATALAWITSARHFKADAALEAGMVDAITETDQLRTTALDWLQRAIDGKLDWQARRIKRRGPFAADPAIFAAARAQAEKNARHTPAALTVVNLLERCAPLTRDEAFAHEADAGATLAHTTTARALVGIFMANQQLRKKTKALSSTGRTIKRVSVLGAGIMGGGIAYTTAVKGIPVLLKDIAQGALDLGTGEAKKLLNKQVDTGRLKAEKAEAILASISPTLEFKEFDSVDIVVEAVVENLKVKQEVLAQVESLVRPGTVLASNTSSLAIADIAATLKRPQDVVGMHFFNPVQVMPLVEVIKSSKSSDAAVATTVAYALAMGKTPLVVKDCPGFLVNRLLGAYFAAFNLLIRDGADFNQIDRAMEQWGLPMGPAYLLDMAGLDTLDKAMAILGKAYPEVMAANFTTVIQLLAGEKRYGQKTGAGFFRYEADAKGKPKRAADPAIVALITRIQPNGTHAFSDEEMVDRLMLAMVLEAARCLDEQVVDSAIEVDAGMRLGTGFPAHHGGPLWYADTMGGTSGGISGLKEVMRRCERYQSLGGAYIPGAGLRRLAEQGKTFYGDR